MIKNKLLFLFKYNKYLFLIAFFMQLVFMLPFYFVNLFISKNFDNEVFLLICGGIATVIGIGSITYNLPKLLVEQFIVNIISAKLLNKFIRTALLFMGLFITPTIISVSLFLFKYHLFTLQNLAISAFILLLVLNLCFIYFVSKLLNVSSEVSSFHFEFLEVGLLFIVTKYSFTNPILIIVPILLLTCLYYYLHYCFKGYIKTGFTTSPVINVNDLTVLHKANQEPLMEDVNFQVTSGIHLLNFSTSKQLLMFCKLKYLKHYDVEYSSNTQLYDKAVLCSDMINNYSKCTVKEFEAFMYNRSSNDSTLITLNSLVNYFIKNDFKVILLPLFSKDDLLLNQLDMIVKQCNEKQITLIISDVNKLFTNQFKYDRLWESTVS